MHVGALVDASRARRPRATTSSRTSTRACTSCRATGRSSPFPRFEMGRPFWVDDPRFNLDYHVRHTALPSPGSDRAAAPAGGPDLLPAARPLEAALGAVARAGPRGQPLRADQQDPPRARRRRLRRRPRDRAVRPRPRARRARAERRRLDAAARAVGRRAGRRGRQGPRRGRRSSWPAGRSALRQHPAARVARGARGRRGRSARSSGPGSTRRPETPLNVPIGPHRRVLVGARAGSTTSRRSRTRSAAPSTTSCWPSSPARSAAGCATRGVRTEGLELRALVPVSIRAEDERGELGNQIAAMRGPLPVYASDPVERLRIVQRGDGRPEGVEAGARRRGDRRACRTSRRRRCSRRPRGSTSRPGSST